LSGVIVATVAFVAIVGLSILLVTRQPVAATPVPTRWRPVRRSVRQR